MTTTPYRAPRRIATLSVHTSPLDQPGTGDAGGLNVYVVEVARRLAARGIEVDVFTRAVCRDTPPLAELAPGVTVRSVVAGPFEELDKTDLPGQVCQFTLEVLRAEAEAEPGRYDLIHAHYWLSGKVGAAAKARWRVPLVQSMHTLGKVKNAALAAGDAAEPEMRIKGEHEVVAAADRLIANTTQEAGQLTELYGADPAKVRTVSPGADLCMFSPGDGPDAKRQVRRRLGTDPDPDGMRELAIRLGIGDLLRQEPPCPQAELADWYRAATLVLTPSHSESFGLVALEAQACGTPVVAASVGGLRTAVKDGDSGILVDGHDPVAWAHAIRQLIRAPRRLAALSEGARRHASTFGWSATVERLAAVYTGAMQCYSEGGRPPVPPEGMAAARAGA